MPMPDQFRLFADDNRLMHRRWYDAAGRLSGEELRRDRGAFFHSVLGTLNHILVGDIIWLQRFASHPSSAESLAQVANMLRPARLDSILHDHLEGLRCERERLDDIITEWLGALSERDLQGSVTYKNMAGQRFRKPFASLVSHLFLHQLHHRGQVTTLLSQTGVDFADSDLVEIIPEGV